MHGASLVSSWLNIDSAFENETGSEFANLLKWQEFSPIPVDRLQFLPSGQQKNLLKDPFRNFVITPASKQEIQDYESPSPRKHAPMGQADRLLWPATLGKGAENEIPQG